MTSSTTGLIPRTAICCMKMMQTRYEIATLLGYSSWADYYAADKMAVNGQNIANFIQRPGRGGASAAQREFAMMLAEKQKTDPGAKEIWDYEVELHQRTAAAFASTTLIHNRCVRTCLIRGEAGNYGHGRATLSI